MLIRGILRGLPVAVAKVAKAANVGGSDEDFEVR